MYADIIKILAMGDKCPGDIDHWLTISESKYKNLCSISEVRSAGMASVVVGFGKEKSVRENKLTNIKKRIPKSTTQEYFDYLWEVIYKQGTIENPKYKHLLSQKPDPVILDQLWFVMCNFTDQANEHSEPWKYSCNTILPLIYLKILNLKKDNLKKNLRV